MNTKTHYKLKGLFEKDSAFFKEVQGETEAQINHGSRCVSKLSRKGFPIVFGDPAHPFDSDAFIDTVKNSILTNLTRDFFRTRRGDCPGCGEWCEKFERAHTIKERPDIAKEALGVVKTKYQNEGVFEMSEFLNEFIQLHREYPLAFVCTACHLIIDKVIRKEIPQSYEELKKIDYTGAEPIDLWMQSPYGDIENNPPRVPKSMSELRHTIFQGIATEHLLTAFSCIKEHPGDFKNIRKFEFIGWCGDKDSAVLDFFMRGSNNNEIMKDVLKAIFEERFEYREPYRYTLFQFDLRLKLRLANGEVLEITNKNIGDRVSFR